MQNKVVSKATLQRYPLYLKALRLIKEKNITKIMSKELSDYVSIEPTTIRRDFSFIGKLGKQGFGYDVDTLIKIFEEQLGVNFDEKIILVGVGNLGRALLNYNKWNNVVGEIVCAYDKNLEALAKQNLPVPVYDINTIKDNKPDGCRIAILTITDDVQETVDLLQEAGIIGIVDFTSEHFIVNKNVIVKPISLVSSIQELVFETNQIK